MRFAPRPLLGLLAIMVLALVPATAGAATKKPVAPSGPETSTVRIQIGHLKGGKAQIMSTVPVIGSVKPSVPGQKVDVSFFLNGKRIEKKSLKVKGGSFRARIRIEDAGKYAASAHLRATGSTRGDETIRKSWKVSFPGLHKGKCGPVVIGFKKAMRKMGYIANDGRCFGGKTARGVLAYRKVNGMARSSRAGAGLVKSAFAGRGEYKVRHPNAGEHLEAPLSKQVLVFAKGDKPFAVYPVSSGKSSTPTVTGHFTFIRTEPGYNSHGMYYSFYFYGGYAIHGYESVPDYPASHGCIRTFISDQPEIYERINYGESIFVF
ncbi:MAG TPA: L,D-transpeptidase [Solirubrobacterales bacterium]